MKDKIMLYATIAIAIVAVIMFAIYPIVFYVLIGVAGFLAIVYLCSKYKWARIATFIAVFVGLIGGSAYSYVKLNEYYTAVGGVFGRISDFFGTNIVEVDDLTFNFSNIQLKNAGDQQQYVAQITKDVKFNIDTDKNYSVYVNEIPCTFVEVTKNYVLADYTYTFQDDDLSEIMTDTLEFRFAFNQNSTQFNISTSGGTKAQRLWNYYFNKNGFVVKLAESKFDQDGSMQQTNGTVDYALANYYVQGSKWMTQCYHINDQVSFPFPDQISTSFIGWSVDYENKIEEPYYITKHTDFYAMEGEQTMFTIVYKHRGQVLFTERFAEGRPLTEPEAPTITGYQFNYWEDENGEQFDFSGKTATKDMILTANATGQHQIIKLKIVNANDMTSLNSDAGGYGMLHYTDTMYAAPGTHFVDHDPDCIMTCSAPSGHDFTFEFCIWPGYEPRLWSSGQILVEIEDYDKKTSTNKVVISDSIVGGESFSKWGASYFANFTISDVNTPMTVVVYVEPIKYNIEFKYVDSYRVTPDLDNKILATTSRLTYGEAVDLKRALSTTDYNTLIDLNKTLNPLGYKVHCYFTYTSVNLAYNPSGLKPIICFSDSLEFLLEDGWNISPYYITSSNPEYKTANYNPATKTFTVEIEIVPKDYKE